jgi:hypothetical protein
MYVGNQVTALGCIDAGITCIIDNSHKSRSPAHSDAAIQALFDAGIRAVHASGAPQNGNWEHQWPQDLDRLQKQFFSSDDQFVTLRMFSGLDRTNWALARRLGLRITSEFQGPQMGPVMELLEREAARAGRHLQPLRRPPVRSQIKAVLLFTSPVPMAETRRAFGILNALGHPGGPVAGERAQMGKVGAPVPNRKSWYKET